MPRYTTVNDCTTRAKNKEEECNGAPNRAKDSDDETLVSLARRKTGTGQVMGRSQPGGGFRS